MQIRLFDADIEEVIGVIEIPLMKMMPKMLRIVPNPVCPQRYFRHIGKDCYYEVTEEVVDLGNQPLLPPSAYKSLKPRKL
jgi:hypothetical protein